MKMKRSLNGCMCLILLLLPLLLAACGLGTEENGGEELSFTVVEDADMPDQLKTILNEKKAEPFQFTYSTDSWLYLAKGYGSQKSGGYSIAVKQLTMAEDGVHFVTELIGPSQQDPVSQTVTYPYIVVKIEFTDKSVVFE